MTTRRVCLAALSGIAVTAAAAKARNTLGEVLKVGPKPKLIKGSPDKVDFGHGLLVPMSNDAFHTLWEGDDRWISYGHGFGHNAAAAMGQAEEAAVGTMKLYLLTLAFAPDRLVRIDGGGWRLKSGKVADLVKGDLKLPGRPVMPTTDAMTGMVGGRHANAGSSASTPDADAGPSASAASGEETVHATTGWLLWKHEVSLDDVRRDAVLLGN
jgi:hypothetical protein